MKLIQLNSIDSTNNEAKKLALNGEPEWTIILAEHQHSGKGSKGRSFFSPEGSGLYMSIVLRPSFSAQKSLLITTAAAVAVARVLERRFSVKAEIKWVNDLYKDGRKICGILTESSLNSDGTLNFAILGIGINLCPASEIPKEIENVIGFVCEEKCEVDKAALTTEIAKEFKKIYVSLENANFADEYNQRLMLKGKKVAVSTPKSTAFAIVLGTDEQLRLIVEYENGERHALCAGEVSISLE